MWRRVSQSDSYTRRQILENSQFISSKWRVLNAFITECWDKAREQSLSIDEDRDNPLCGMPLAVKDNFCTKGIKTTCGSKMLENFTPSYNSTVVGRLEQSGMLTVGKTNMDSFAMGSGTLDGIHGPTKNPWTWLSTTTRTASGGEPLDNEMNVSETVPPPALHPADLAQDTVSVGDFRMAGGSSGGSAAAVAAGIVYGALGSDTGGSVRVPASYCGVVGLKPTYGLVSRHGLIPLVNSLDCPGVITQTVQQCTHMFNVIAGHDPMDSTTYHSQRFGKVKLIREPSVRSLRVGIPKEYHAPEMSAEVLSAWTEIAEVLSEAGAVVEEVSLPHTQYSISCYSVLNCCEVASNMARYDGVEFGHRADTEHSTEELFAQTRHQAFTDIVRGRIFAGNYFLLKKNYGEYYMQAARLRRLIYEEFLRVFTDVDILLAPVTPDEAPLYSVFKSEANREQCTKHDVYTQPSNLAGVPALCVPIKLSKNRLPIGLQIIGPHFSEETLLNVGNFIEQKADFSKHYTDILA